MKRISIWAKNYVWQSRLLIVIIYILLNVFGIFTGKLLKEVNVILPALYFTACIIFTILLWMLYPDKNWNTGRNRSNYFRRKLSDLSLATVTFLMIIYAGNHWEHLFLKTTSATASKIIRIPKDSVAAHNLLIRNFVASIKAMDVSKLSQREKIRIIKKQIRTVEEDNGTSKGEKTLLIILSIVIALGLLFALGALSCSIACGGAEALAAVVGIIGTFFIIFFLVRTIKRISKGPKPKKEVVEDKTVIP